MLASVTSACAAPATDEVSTDSAGLSGDGPAVVTLEARVQPSAGGLPARLLADFLVKDIAYDKSVTVVYTQDGWATAVQAQAQYVPTGSSDGYQRWNLTTFLARGTTPVEFAVAYSVLGNTYWDNNRGANYDTSTRPPPPICEVTWTSASASLAVDVQFKVRNVAYHKQIGARVLIDHQAVDFLSAHYVRTLDDGRELWEGAGTFAEGPTGTTPRSWIYPACTVLGKTFTPNPTSAPFPGSFGAKE